ncbi:dTDP-4-dehydrorhamnose 3,5-epimerase [Polymorphobacter multimanifer]|uniref:dTDP-4-dehydrorhamnose 3,5-epimerase n=1 Tax=Polymorphobacter multimanifer TaxID=1070431 RepID=A0A841L7L7_9SPHN|nr:dTDP-4-dehydrorhamnose 3,5-epimerase [Polymorphobacter multimanifer]MBB6225855.1 dTDP-4-dehydrorhamnose 3,5-epimerase [Polymorphobacter multimanifer]GGI86876.1 dTDP-4-dehydrorhamnose 3,5-epimerase [Polymorphobacter multimanifer]
MEIIETPLPGVLRLKPRVFGDARGFFTESWNARTMRDAGLDIAFVQDNHSRSARGVLRGLHFQLANPQGKLIRVGRGAVYDVAVDLRRSSSHFGQWFGLELSDENHEMLWIPPGFGHGFLTLSDVADFHYKVTTHYDAASDRSLAWNDPEIGIAWPDTGAAPQLSAKDIAAPTLAHAEVFA